MIRPIKIFLYYLLIAVLVAGGYYWLKQENISLVPAPDRSARNQPNDKGQPIELLPDEVISQKDSASGSPDDSLKRTEAQEETPSQVQDSLLIAQKKYKQLFETICNNAANKPQHTKGPVRVLHIGDSQIEADRITSVLREHFQNRFGGSGPGLVMPYDPLRINATMRLNNKGSWNLDYSYRDRHYPHPVNFGFSGKLAWFSGNEAEFSVTPHPLKTGRIQNFQNLKLLTSVPEDSLTIRITSDATALTDTILSSSSQMHIIQISQKKYFKKVNFHFQAKQSPAFHGLTLDGNTGVAVDNISMRGRPWPGIRLAGKNILSQMGQELNTGMIIIQFGTNVLPTIAEDYNFYRIHFLRELRLLQEILPKVPVLIIGVQASAITEEGKPKPLKHAKHISNAQRSAALACDMAFFDLHKMMGGEEGAINWNQIQPPLMLSDYIHFSNRGAKKVGNRIWESLETLRKEIQ